MAGTLMYGLTLMKLRTFKNKMTCHLIGSEAGTIAAHQPALFLNLALAISVLVDSE